MRAVLTPLFLDSVRPWWILSEMTSASSSLTSDTLDFQRCISKERLPVRERMKSDEAERKKKVCDQSAQADRVGWFCRCQCLWRCLSLA